jgi:ABC-type spermidine/putrescine transport system permease subunit I
VVAFVGLPIVTALLFSLGRTDGLNQIIAMIGQNVHRPADGQFFTTGAYEQIFADERFVPDLVLTLSVTAIVTISVAIIAIAIGLMLKLRGGWLPNFLAGLAVVPLFIPVVIAAWAILMFYAQDGFVRSFLSLFGIDGPTWGYTSVAIVLGNIWTSLPFSVLMVSSGFQSIPDSMIEAARDAGAGFFSVVRKVLIPMAGVPITIATTFTAIGVLGSFTVAYFTGANTPNMLGVELNNFFVGFNQPQQAQVIAFVIFFFASAIAATYVWANFRTAKDAGRV